MTPETKTEYDKKWFELAPDRTIKEADWRHGSIFITGGAGEVGRTSMNYIVNKKPKHSYVFANTAKHARRIFHKRHLM